MEFLLMICHDESFASTEGLIADIMTWIEEMERRGVRRYGNPLRPPGQGKTIRVREGTLSLTDGAFAGSGETMSAYELLECASMEEAVCLAARHPMARAGSIEVRPVWTELGRR